MLCFRTLIFRVENNCVAAMELRFSVRSIAAHLFCLAGSVSRFYQRLLDRERCVWYNGRCSMYERSVIVLAKQSKKKDKQKAKGEPPPLVSQLLLRILPGSSTKHFHFHFICQNLTMCLI